MHNTALPGMIEVTGYAEVSAPPDEALVILDVITQAETASLAISLNAELTRAVIEAVEAEPNTGITTSGLSVYPIYSYDPDTHVSTISAFTARNGVRVRTEPAAAGRVFDAGVEAGANVSSGILYRIRDESPLREQALREAFEVAAREADLVADAAGVGLLGPEGIWIEPLQNTISLRAQKLAADGPVSPTIPEDVSVAASVRVQFRLEVG
jgi:uncharacterized protein